jgi:hypothetical protein
MESGKWVFNEIKDLENRKNAQKKARNKIKELAYGKQ